MTKTVWLMSDRGTDEALCSLLQQDGINAVVVPPEERINFLQKVSRAELDAPDLIISGWREGGAFGNDVTIPPGEALTQLVKLEAPYIPMMIFTGDQSVGMRKFPGLDVSVVLKIVKTEEILGAIKQRLAAPQREVR